MIRFTPILILCAVLVSCLPVAPVQTSVNKDAPYLHFSLESSVSPNAESRLVAVTGLVYLRAEATEHSAALDSYAAGDVLRVYGCKVDEIDGGTFARVRGGWVNAKYLESACN